MSSLRAPGLGPLVGHTTSTSARIWIRANDPEEDGANVARHRRTIGIIALTHEGDQLLERRHVYYFRLRREYDRTGTFTLGDEAGLEGSPVAAMKPGTSYRARVGTLSIDDPHPDDESIPNQELARRLPDPSVWWNELLGLPSEESEACFTTFREPDAPADTLSFIVGSCRYPGLLWKAKHSDRIFGPLLAEAQGRDDRPPAAFALMMGDQIYADMLNRHVPIGLADTFEEFQSRYHAAFGSTRMRALLRALPTYMILDDHEIEDNWSQDRITRAAKRRLFNVAINAYMSYQWVHGPTRYGKRLFYDFACAGYPVFVLDTRTQRFMDDVPGSLDDNHMLGRPSLDPEEPNQLDLLLDWLETRQKEIGDAPKFIVSSSVFVPSPIRARTGRKGSPEKEVGWKESSDAWPAFPTTRRALLRCIIENGIQNVVFLSGDIHCANVAEMRFTGSPEAEKLKAYSITSSAFYWPFPFADGDPSDFVHDSTAAGQEDTFAVDDRHRMDYRAWNFTQEDNFCRLDLDRTSKALTVRVFGSDGRPLRKGSWLRDDGPMLETVLDLAPW